MGRLTSLLDGHTVTGENNIISVCRQAKISAASTKLVRSPGLVCRRGRTPSGHSCPVHFDEKTDYLSRRPRTIVSEWPVIHSQSSAGRRFEPLTSRETNWLGCYRTSSLARQAIKESPVKAACR